MFRYSNDNLQSTPSITTINNKIYQDITDKEYAIIKDIFLGLANQQIASKQFISINTVKTHIKNIYIKIDVHNRAELVRWLSQM